MCSVWLNLGVFENNEPFKHLLGFRRPGDRNIIQPLFYKKTASMSKYGHTRKSLYWQWIQTGSDRSALYLLLPVEFTCIEHFLSLTPSGCI